MQIFNGQALGREEQNSKQVGYGDRSFKLAVYLENPPAVTNLRPSAEIKALQAGDIADIVAQTGNHWRKIFTIYAKLMWHLAAGTCDTWQQYRDKHLLQASSAHALLFSAPELCQQPTNACFIVGGKTYAEKLGLLSLCDDIGEGFFLSPAHKLIVTPYFDYRQLSNVKLARLISILQAIKSKQA